MNGLIPKLLIMKNLKVLAVIMAAITILGCTREPAVTSDTVNKEEISRQLAENWDQFIMAFTNEDIEKLMSFVTDDYINMPAYGMTQNYQESQAMFQGMMDDYYFEKNTYEQKEVFVHPGMAYEFGLIQMVLVSKSQGDTVINNTLSVSVWKKMDDGSWKLHRWMGQD